MKKFSLIALTLLSTAACAGGIDVEKVSAGFSLSYNLVPMGAQAKHRWLVEVSPDSSLSYSGAYQETLPDISQQRCSPSGGQFETFLESSEHADIMTLALAARKEQKIINDGSDKNNAVLNKDGDKEGASRNVLNYILRTELGSEFVTAQMTQEGPHTVKFMQALAPLVKRAYASPRQAIKLDVVKLADRWQLTFTSRARMEQSFNLPRNAHEAFFIQSESGERKGHLEYAKAPDKFKFKLKNKEQVKVEIAMPKALGDGERLVFDNSVIVHHADGKPLMLQLCAQ